MCSSSVHEELFHKRDIVAVRNRNVHLKPTKQFLKKKKREMTELCSINGKNEI